MMAINIYAKGIKYDVTATMEDDYSVIVKKGGMIAIESGKSLSRKVAKLRENPEFVDLEGRIIKEISFKSVSTAACFVTGTMSNGFKIWHYESNGELIKRK